jgi:hypothetical protein
MNETERVVLCCYQGRERHLPPVPQPREHRRSFTRRPRRSPAGADFLSKTFVVMPALPSAMRGEAMDDRTPVQKWLGDPPRWRSAFGRQIDHLRARVLDSPRGLDACPQFGDDRT